MRIVPKNTTRALVAGVSAFYPRHCHLELAGMLYYKRALSHSGKGTFSFAAPHLLCPPPPLISPRSLSRAAQPAARPRLRSHSRSGSRPGLTLTARWLTVRLRLLPRARIRSSNRVASISVIPLYITCECGSDSPSLWWCLRPRELAHRTVHPVSTCIGDQRY